MGKLTRFNLVGPITARDSGIDKDQRFINCFPEKLSEEETYVVKRAGLKADVDCTAVTGSTPEARGVYSWIDANGTEKLMSLWDNHVMDSASEISTATALTYTTGRCYMATATDNDLLILEKHATAGKLHYWDGTTFNTVSDGDFPGQIDSGLVQLDGYTFVLSGNQIHNSALNDVTTWGASDFLTANLVDDTGMAIARHINYLVYFGSKSLLFYDNKGNTSGSPMGRLSGTASLIGCAGGDTVVNVERTIFWVATAQGGGHFVAALEGLQPIGISTKPIEEALDKEGGDLSSAYAWTCRVQGHSFYVLTLPTTVQKTFAYDITEGIWTEWTSYDGVSESYFTGFAATSFADIVHIQDEDNGEVYELDAETYQDDSQDILVEGHTLKWDQNNSFNKIVNRTTVIGDTDTTDATNLDLAWSDDDYQTFSTDRTIDLNDNIPSLTRCGLTRRRSFRYKFANNRPMRLRRLELQYDTGDQYGYSS